MLRFAPSWVSSPVVIIELSITTKVSCDCSCITKDKIVIKVANLALKVTFVTAVPQKVVIHVTVVIDIVPAWLFLWKFNISCSLLAFVDPLISSVEAVFEHALLTQADGLRKFVIKKSAVSVGAVVSEFRSFSWMSIPDAVLVAVGIELFGTLFALHVLKLSEFFVRESLITNLLWLLPFSFSECESCSPIIRSF